MNSALHLRADVMVLTYPEAGSTIYEIRENLRPALKLKTSKPSEDWDRCLDELSGNLGSSTEACEIFQILKARNFLISSHQGLQETDCLSFYPQKNTVIIGFHSILAACFNKDGIFSAEDFGRSNPQRVVFMGTYSCLETMSDLSKEIVACGFQVGSLALLSQDYWAYHAKFDTQTMLRFIYKRLGILGKPKGSVHTWHKLSNLNCIGSLSQWFGAESEMESSACFYGTPRAYYRFTEHSYQGEAPEALYRQTMAELFCLRTQQSKSQLELQSFFQRFSHPFSPVLRSFEILSQEKFCKNLAIFESHVSLDQWPCSEEHTQDYFPSWGASFSNSGELSAKEISILEGLERYYLRNCRGRIASKANFFPVWDSQSKACQWIKESLVFTNSFDPKASVTSNGTAFHFNRKSAFISSLFELIERDVFLNYWYLKREPHPLGADSLTANCVDCCESLRASGVDVNFWLLINDFELPVVAVSLCQLDKTPYFALGTSCAFLIKPACEKALVEAVTNFQAMSQSNYQLKSSGDVLYRGRNKFAFETKLKEHSFLSEPLKFEREKPRKRPPQDRKRASHVPPLDDRKTIRLRFVSDLSSLLAKFAAYEYHWQLADLGPGCDSTYHVFKVICEHLQALQFTPHGQINLKRIEDFCHRMGFEMPHPLTFSLSPLS